jgi:hypothetical protein
LILEETGTSFMKLLQEIEKKKRSVPNLGEECTKYLNQASDRFKAAFTPSELTQDQDRIIQEKVMFSTLLYYMFRVSLYLFFYT